jgi:glycosyltransferase involved in cell wall biosynthesis
MSGEVMPSSPLARGNRAMRQGQWAQAAGLYLQAIRAEPGAAWLKDNVALLGRQYRRRPRAEGRLSVGVCGWELSHNAAGRVQTLADLYGRFADVQMMGCHFPSWGRALWAPLQPARWPLRSIVVDDEARFMHQALDLVSQNPLDVVHLSKPRAPNVLIGMLYKLLWGARVFMDVDDEELAFVGAATPLSLAEDVQLGGGLPPVEALPGQRWTRLAVGMVSAFDGVTVSNPALQARYGGQLVYHARDEALFVRKPGTRAAARARFGIAPEKKVVLFFGTARAHKGLIETAEAIAKLPSRDVVFVVAGALEDAALRARLLAVQGCNTQLLGPQPFADVPAVVAMADACVLLQHTEATVSQFQVPAKLSDALAMGVPVLASPTAAMSEFIARGALLPVQPETLAEQLGRLLQDETLQQEQSARGVAAFRQLLSFEVNAAVLQNLVHGQGTTAGHAWQWPDLAAPDIGGPKLALEAYLGAALREGQVTAA